MKKLPFKLGIKEKSSINLPRRIKIIFNNKLNVKNKILSLILLKIFT
jgi:hypothetical protein